MTIPQTTAGRPLHKEGIALFSAARNRHRTADVYLGDSYCGWISAMLSNALDKFYSTEERRAA
jgi:hypothetical protein